MRFSILPFSLILRSIAPTEFPCEKYIQINLLFAIFLMLRKLFPYLFHFVRHPANSLHIFYHPPTHKYLKISQENKITFEFLSMILCFYHLIHSSCYLSSFPNRFYHLTIKTFLEATVIINNICKF